MRRALIVGIDDYGDAPLSGCVNDANKICELLEKNEDGSPNFDCMKLTSDTAVVERSSLRENVERLLKDPAEVALFYFSGHGTENNLGGYLVTQDAKIYDEGVSMLDILRQANSSPVKEIAIILDCCHSGSLGSIPEINNSSVLREGITIVTASRESQSSIEVNGNGLFTSHLCAALEGGASDVLGKVTIANLYAYLDECFGAWEQRPLFKSHVARLICLRQCAPVIPLEILRELPRYFNSSTKEHTLDPEYEPEEGHGNKQKETIFFHLQKMRDARLVVPVGEDHMYHAAVKSKSCCLTPLGQYYWHLANEGRI